MKVCFEASPLPLWGPKAAKIQSELSNVFPRVYKLPSELRCHLPQKPRSMRVLDPKHDPSTSTALRTKASIWFLCSFFSFCLLEAHGTPVGYSLLRQGGVTAMLKLAHTWEAPMASKNPLYKQEMRESCSLGERRSSVFSLRDVKAENPPGTLPYTSFCHPSATWKQVEDARALFQCLLQTAVLFSKQKWTLLKHP